MIRLSSASDYSQKAEQVRELLLVFCKLNTFRYKFGQMDYKCTQLIGKDKQI